jgi:hypothetical protein
LSEFRMSQHTPSAKTKGIRYYLGRVPAAFGWGAFSLFWCYALSLPLIVPWYLSFVWKSVRFRNPFAKYEKPDRPPAT